MPGWPPGRRGGNIAWPRQTTRPLDWRCAQQLGLPSDASLNLQGDLTRFAWLSVADAFCQVAQNGSIDPQRLAAEMAEARPDVMAARSAAGVARANADLARAARIQDVQAGPIYQTADDGTHYLGLRLQRDFGVFNNGSALQNQRLTEVRQLLLAHDQLRRRASGEAAAAIDRYERARRYVAETAGEDAPTPRRRWTKSSPSSNRAGPTWSMSWRFKTICSKTCGPSST